MSQTRSSVSLSSKLDQDAIRTLLERAVGIDLQDAFQFIIGEPTLDLDAAPYGGARYPVEAHMAGRRTC